MNGFVLRRPLPPAGRHGLVRTQARGLPLLGQVLGLAALYMLGGAFGLQLAAPPGYASAFWAPAGISLAAVLLLGYRVWPGVLLGSFVVNCWVAWAAISAGDLRLVVTALAIAVGAVLQATIAAWMLRRDGTFPATLDTGGEITRFLIVAGPVGCVVNASLGPLVLLGAGVLDVDGLLFNAWNWWVGDTIGVVIVTPLLFACAARPGTLWHARRRFVIAPMLLATVAVIAAFVVTRAGDRARIDAELGEYATGFSKSVATSLRRTLDAVVSVRSFYDSSQFVSREEFHSFTEQLLAEHPEITALSWNAAIPHARRTRLEAEARGAGIPEYRVKERRADGTLVEAQTRDSYIVVHYIEPLAENRVALGFNVNADPKRVRAFERARDTGRAVATERLWLFQADRSVAGILLIQPVYAEGDPQTVVSRRELLSGFVVGVIEVDRLVASAFAELRSRALEPSVHDVTDGIDERLSSATASLDVSVASDVRRFEFGGREWELRIAGGGAFATRQRSPAAWFVLAGGLALTSILGAFLLLVAAHRHHDRLQTLRLRKEIERRQRFESALHSEKERVVVTLQSIADGVISADRDGRVTFINRIGEALTGWQAADAVGRPIDEVFKLRHDSDDTGIGEALPLSGSGGEQVDDEVILVGGEGREFGIRYSVSPLLDSDGGSVGTVTAFQDVTEARRMAREVAHRANHDALTGLVNRAEFERRLERALANFRRADDSHVVFFMDLDKFKIVNDSAGHAAGDQLLREVSEMLHAEVRSRDTLARLGGDEFGMLFEGCPLQRGVAIAESCVRKLRDYRFTWGSESFQVGISIGVIVVDSASESLDSVMTRADAACYQAKHRGRNRVHVGDEAGGGSGQQELRRVAELRRLLDDRRLLALYAEPIASLSGAGEPRFELLLHYRDSDGVDMLSDELVRTAERYGSMSEIDQWLANEALTVYRSEFGAPARISINLSVSSLGHADFAESLAGTLQSMSLAPGTLCVEITETAALRDIETTGRFMRALKTHGCEFALDDFGSGPSSIACLRDLPLDYIKIDKARSRDIATDPLARGLVEIIQRTASLFGLRTIAKGVADDATLAVLKAIGVDFAQGPAVGHPEPLRRSDTGDQDTKLPRYG